VQQALLKLIEGTIAWQDFFSLLLTNNVFI
jgi:hypothetical protein